MNSETSQAAFESYWETHQENFREFLDEELLALVKAACNNCWLKSELNCRKELLDMAQELAERAQTNIECAKAVNSALDNLIAVARLMEKKYDQPSDNDGG